VNERVKEKGPMWKDFEDLRDKKAILGMDFTYSFSCNLGSDLEQLRKYEPSDIHPSILTLDKDPHKALAI